MFATGVPDAAEELRTHTNDWLRAAREEAVREERRWHLRKVLITGVLAERGLVDDSFAQVDGVSVRDVHDEVETARALESLPAIAEVAAQGGLSDQQLTEVVKLADASSDGEWAVRAPGCSPENLRREARRMVKPTTADAAARRAARRFWFHDDQTTGMISCGGELPDVDGVMVMGVFEHMTRRMTPTKGHAWDTVAHRNADALVELCRNYAHVHAVSGPDIDLVAEVPMHGPATIAGIPLPDSMVEALRAQARVEPVLVDDAGLPVARGRSRSALGPKTTRAIKLRDGKCRWPGCERRTGLQVHHLTPKSWGGSDEYSNLACVCSGGGTDHHAQLVPRGPYHLVGNPNLPDGLHLEHRNQHDHHHQGHRPDRRDQIPKTGDTRAGPTAA